MNKFTDDSSFRQGYFMALVDIVNFVENHSVALRHEFRAKRLEAVVCIMKYLLENRLALDEFIKTGGIYPEFKVSNKPIKGGGYIVNKV